LPGAPIGTVGMDDDDAGYQSMNHETSVEKGRRPVPLAP
jgi:hypothetical protein